MRTLSVNNNSLSHVHNGKNNLSGIGEVQLMVLMEALVQQIKTLVLVSVKQIQSLLEFAL